MLSKRFLRVVAKPNFQVRFAATKSSWMRDLSRLGYSTEMMQNMQKNQIKEIQKHCLTQSDISKLGLTCERQIRLASWQKFLFSKMNQMEPIKMGEKPLTNDEILALIDVSR